MPTLTTDMIQSFIFIVLAGLTTVIGGLLAVVGKRPSEKVLCASMGFSAGMLVFIAFFEILKECSGYFASSLSPAAVPWATVGAFFAGILIVAFIDKLLPEDPHEFSAQAKTPDQSAILKSGAAVLAAIALHNLPEGLVTFSLSRTNFRLGLPILIAFALHNIPEGLAVASPVFMATGKRFRAVWLTFEAGMFLPLGALLGYFLPAITTNGVVMGILFGLTAGAVIFIALNELYPNARNYKDGTLGTYSLVGGMAFAFLIFQVMG